MKTESESNLDASLRLREGRKGDGAGIRALVFGVLADYGLRPDPEHTIEIMKTIKQSLFKNFR